MKGDTIGRTGSINILIVGRGIAMTTEVIEGVTERGIEIMDMIVDTIEEDIIETGNSMKGEKMIM